MDKYDPYTDKFLRDTQYNILGTNLAEVGTDVPDINVGELISREQAIETFKDCAANGVGIDGIVDALKQLPPANCSEFPNNSDTISRQAAIDALVAETIYTEEELKEYYEANSHRNEWVNGIYEAAERIKQLPPIQPKRGRWIGKYPVTSVCSECGFLIHDSKVKAFAYCPNCGADMREKGENSESN